MSARDTNFEFGRLILTLENSDLSVDTLQATYKQTRISGNFYLYPESPPRVAAKFLVRILTSGVFSGNCGSARKFGPTWISPSMSTPEVSPCMI
jgi:hypothetical protein